MEFEKANEKIKSIRKALGLSQTEFGKIVGKKQTTIADWENNKIALNVNSINCFLDAISIYFENLFYDKKTRDEIINNKNLTMKMKNAFILYKNFLYDYVKTFNNYYRIEYSDKDFSRFFLFNDNKLAAINDFNNKEETKDIKDYFDFVDFLLADDDNNN